MNSRKIVLYYEYIRKTMSNGPVTLQALANGLMDEFGLNSNYVYVEIRELIALKKIKEIRVDGRKMLEWTNVVPKFEYELSTNIVKLRKQFCVFLATLSAEHTVNVPAYITRELNTKVFNISTVELMLELKAIKTNNVWYNVKME